MTTCVLQPDNHVLNGGREERGASSLSLKKLVCGGGQDSALQALSLW